MREYRYDKEKNDTKGVRAMFSNEERMIYAKRQLVEVICQLRFPEILSIDASEPAAFQDRIRREYPQYEKKIEHFGCKQSYLPEDTLMI